MHLLNLVSLERGSPCVGCGQRERSMDVPLEDKGRQDHGKPVTH